MRRQGEIDISQIIIDKLPLNMDTFRLALFLFNGGEVPAIKVQLLEMGRHAGNFKIKDGRHRIAAYKLLGRRLIPARWGVRKDGFNVEPPEGWWYKVPKDPGAQAYKVPLQQEERAPSQAETQIEAIRKLILGTY